VIATDIRRKVDVPEDAGGDEESGKKERHERHVVSGGKSGKSWRRSD